uniref:Expressed protein n=1 Tax=Echinococcus granulosus TaxID=6210 RepID=A0A068WFY5_ECHGR|nr:expressed protein [Echinococcus granulosus]
MPPLDSPYLATPTAVISPSLPPPNLILSDFISFYLFTYKYGPTHNTHRLYDLLLNPYICFGLTSFAFESRSLPPCILHVSLLSYSFTATTTKITSSYKCACVSVHCIFYVCMVSLPLFVQLHYCCQFCGRL